VPAQGQRHVGVFVEEEGEGEESQGEGKGSYREGGGQGGGGTGSLKEFLVGAVMGFLLLSLSQERELWRDGTAPGSCAWYGEEWEKDTRWPMHMPDMCFVRGIWIERFAVSKRHARRRTN